MFGKEQPDVVTEEEVGEYIEQLKRDGLEEIDYAELEARVMALPEKERNLQQYSFYAEIYGSGNKHTATGRLQGRPDTFAKMYGTKFVHSDTEEDLDELARLSEDSTSGTQDKK